MGVASWKLCASVESWGSGVWAFAFRVPTQSWMDAPRGSQHSYQIIIEIVDQP